MQKPKVGKIEYPTDEKNAAAAWLSKHKHLLPKEGDGRDSTNIQPYGQFWEHDTRALDGDASGDVDDCDGVDYLVENAKSDVEVSRTYHEERDQKARDQEQAVRDAAGDDDDDEEVFRVPDAHAGMFANEEVSGALASGWRNVERILRQTRSGVSVHASPREWLRWETSNGKGLRHQSRGERVNNPLGRMNADRAATLEAAKVNDKPAVVAVEQRHPYRSITAMMYDSLTDNFREARRDVIVDDDLLRRSLERKSPVRTESYSDRNDMVMSAPINHAVTVDEKVVADFTAYRAYINDGVQWRPAQESPKSFVI